MKLDKLIQTYKQRTGLNNDKIAKKLNVSKSTVGRWAKGQVVSLNSETANRLSKLLGVDIEDLLYQDGFMYRKPILGTVKAGYDMLAQEDIEDYIEVNSSDYKQGDYFLRVKGNSMELAHIFEDDLVYIQQCDTVPSGSIAVVLIGEEATLKKVIYKNDLLILEAASPNVENRYFTKKEVMELPVRILGKVLYVRREF